MKSILLTVFIMMLFCIILSACAKAQTSVEATSTLENTSILITQTSPDHIDKSTPEPTSTITSTPTKTKVPTSTPNQTATIEAANIQAARAEQHITQTASALSAQTTQQAEDELWEILLSDNSITYSKGALFVIDDLEISLSGLNRYSWSSFDYKISDFVIMSHFEWEFPQDVRGRGACGFVFRLKDKYNHLIIWLGNYADLLGMTPNGYMVPTVRRLTPDKENYNEYSGSSDIMVVAQGEIVTAYINGIKTLQWYVARINRGDIGYAILSKSDKEPGTICRFTNTRIWELVK